jgi:hypothetical protein
MTEYLGFTVDLWTLDGRYYKEITILDVVEDLKGLKVQDNQDFKDAIKTPYFVFQIVELIVIRSPESYPEDIRQAVKKDVG